MCSFRGPCSGNKKEEKNYVAEMIIVTGRGESKHFERASSETYQIHLAVVKQTNTGKYPIFYKGEIISLFFR